MKGVEAENVEAAMFYLAETDGLYATAKTDVKRTEILRKRVRARVFLQSDGTVAQREAVAETHADTELADGEHFDAVAKFETLHARRERAALVIDLYRTLEASRRKGA